VPSSAWGFKAPQSTALCSLSNSDAAKQVPLKRSLKKDSETAGEAFEDPAMNG